MYNLGAFYLSVVTNIGLSARGIRIEANDDDINVVGAEGKKVQIFGGEGANGSLDFYKNNGAGIYFHNVAQNNAVQYVLGTTLPASGSVDWLDISNIGGITQITLNDSIQAIKNNTDSNFVPIKGTYPNKSVTGVVRLENDADDYFKFKDFFVHDYAFTNSTI